MLYYNVEGRADWVQLDSSASAPPCGHARSAGAKVEDLNPSPVPALSPGRLALRLASQGLWAVLAVVARARDVRVLPPAAVWEHSGRGRRCTDSRGVSARNTHA
jgi:hypothetical protein